MRHIFHVRIQNKFGRAFVLAPIWPWTAVYLLLRGYRPHWSPLWWSKPSRNQKRQEWIESALGSFYEKHFGKATPQGD